MKDLFKLNKRDWIGLVCWFLSSVLIGIIALPLMVWREVYQYYKYQLLRFEWEDIVRYSLVIIIGSVMNYWLLDLLL
jgi:hypothetical protein